MNGTTKMGESYARRLVEAAAWRTHLTEIGVESSTAFEEWLAFDDRNQAAWNQVQEPWEFFGEQATSPELMEARRKTLGQAQAAGRKRWRKPIFANAFPRSAIAAGVVLISVATLIGVNFHRTDIYRTNSGDRRTVMLADSSKLTLDAQTEVRVRFSRTARELELIKGQARFDVAHDVQRPFSVLAGGEKIIATGTAFDVDLFGPKVSVTLIEGHVVVLSEMATHSGDTRSRFVPIPNPQETERLAASMRRAGSIELSAGERLVVSPGSAPNIESVNVERATAWQSGQLVFENEPLLSVVTRINRYSTRPLSISDANISGLRISGVFNADDIDGFVTTITHYLPVSAEEGNGGIRFRSR